MEKKGRVKRNKIGGVIKSKRSKRSDSNKGKEG